MNNKEITAQAEGFMMGVFITALDSTIGFIYKEMMPMIPIFWILSFIIGFASWEMHKYER